MTGGGTGCSVSQALARAAGRCLDRSLDLGPLGLSKSAVCLKRADRSLQDLMHKNTEGERIERQRLLGFLRLTPAQARNARQTGSDRAAAA